MRAVSLAAAATLLLWLHGARASALDLEVSVSPEEVILGAAESADVTVLATGEGSERLRWIRLTTSTGAVSLPRRIGPGTWSATFTPPEGRSPRVALIVARGGSGEAASFGGVAVRLPGQAELPLRTDPSASVTVEVGGRRFGPVRAGRDGVARIPVVVPPGASTAVAESVDSLGNRSEVEIPLEVPPFPRVLMAASGRGTAGATTRVAVLAAGEDGVITQRIEMTSSRGRLRAVSTGPVVVVYELTMPDRVGSGTVSLSASTEGDARGGTATGAIVIEPREPDGIVLTPDRDALVPGTDQVLTLQATVRDRHGNVRPRAPVALTVDGSDVETAPGPIEGVTASIAAPPVDAGVGAMVVRATSGDLEASLEIRLVGGAAALARIEAPQVVVADGRHTTPVRVLLTGRTGLPASDVPVVRASEGRLRSLEQDEDGWWRAEWLPPRARAGRPSHASIEAGRGSAVARARIRLVEPEPWLSLAVTGGVYANLGALVGPAGRLEIGTRFRMPVGWLAVGLFSGFSFARLSEDLERGHASLRLWQVPLGGGFGWGVRLGPRAGFELMARGGGILVTAESTSTFQPHSTRTLVTALVEGTVGLTVRLFLGEGVARLGYAYAPAPEGSDLTGNLWGLTAMIGYRAYLL